MNAAAAIAHEQDRPAPARAAALPVIEWRGVLFSMSAAAPMPTRGLSAPEAVDVLRGFTAPRARLGAREVPHGPERRMLAQMCASGLVPGRAWAPSNTPSWIAHLSAEAAMRAYAAGLLGEVRAAGLDLLRVVVRAQSAEVAGLFLDARAVEGRPALFDGPEGVGPSQRVAARIAAAERMAGVLIEGGVVAIYRLDAIRLRPLGASYEIIVRADGQAVARRIGQRGGYSA